MPGGHLFLRLLRFQIYDLRSL